MGGGGSGGGGGGGSDHVEWTSLDNSGVSLLQVTVGAAGMKTGVTDQAGAWLVLAQAGSNGQGSSGRRDGDAGGDGYCGGGGSGGSYGGDGGIDGGVGMAGSGSGSGNGGEGSGFDVTTIPVSGFSLT